MATFLPRLTAAVFITLGCTTFSATAQSTDAGTKADNTKVNKADRAQGAVTADQGKNDKSDVKLAASVRKAIRSDKSLSTYAHNVKVIAQNGQVTLKGPVRSDEEKQAVLSQAKTAAGGSNVTDELTVAPPKHAKAKPTT